MRAVGLVPKRSGLELLDVPEPTLRTSDDVVLKVLEVGVCGTDREIARGDLGEAPPDHEHLIIGHEMLAEVRLPVANEHFRRERLAIVVRRHRKSVRSGPLDDEQVADGCNGQASLADEASFFLRENVA